MLKLLELHTSAILQGMMANRMSIFTAYSNVDQKLTGSFIQMLSYSIARIPKATVRLLYHNKTLEIP